MKIYRIFSLLLGLSLSILLTNCTDPIDIGAELLDEDRASVGFTDTLSVRATTVIGDSIPNLGFRYQFGREINPVFGTTEAALYIEPKLHRLITGGLLTVPDGIANATIDSIYLVLPLDSSGVFGDVSGEFGVEVYELGEELEPGEDGIFYSNTAFTTTGSLLGSTTFVPNFDTTFVGRLINFQDLNDIDTFTINAPHVRVPLDPAFGQRLLALDTVVYRPETISDADSLVALNFKGMFLKPTGNSAGLLDINLTQNWTGFYIYYTVGGQSYSYKYDFTNVSARRFDTYQHDYTGSLVEEFLSSQPANDSLVFVQGLQGLFTKLDFPDLSQFSGKVINQAFLEVTTATPLDYDYGVYSAVPQLLVVKRDSSLGTFLRIDDLAVTNDFRSYFGGFAIEQEDGSFKYDLNISVHLQYILDGSEPNEIYLVSGVEGPNVPNYRLRPAERAILSGPGAAQQPIQLKVSFTEN